MKTFRAAVAASMAWMCTGFTLYTMTDQDKKDIVDRHNRLRAMYGACELVWDESVANATVYGDKIGTCTNGADVSGENFAQNLFPTGTPIDVNTMVSIWENQENQYNTLAHPLPMEVTNVRCFTQMVWKSSLKIGCGLCTHQLDFGLFAYMACQYVAPGDIAGEFGTQVGNKGDTCDKCAGVTCGPKGPCYETGKCDPNTGTCEYPIKADDTACTNSNNEQGTCTGGDCIIPDPCDGVVCVPLSQCHLKGTCTNGVCSNPVWTPTQTIDPGNPGTCDDGNQYTINDMCNNGKCVGIDLCENVQCNSVDTTCKMHETCNHLTGQCDPGANAADGTVCDDSNSATVDDKCMSGVCVGVDKCAGVTCTSTDPCKNAAGTCDINTGSCIFTNKPNGQPCDDRDATTTSDMCTDGVCKGENLCAGVTCVPKDECHDAFCDFTTGQCYELAKVSSGDGSPMKCITCTGVVCPDLGECKKTSACDPNSGKCTNENMADNTPCDDGNSVTVDDKCTSGVCTGIDKCANVTCTAIDDCHVAGVCDYNTGVCSNPPAADGTQCDFRTMAGKCTKGTCGLDCTQTMCNSPSDQCKEAICTTTGCEEHAVTGTPCDDGNAATVNDMCNNGQCVGTDLCASVTCTAPNVCSTVACDPMTGRCVKTPANAQQPCDDGNTITVNDACTSDGRCVGVELCANVNCTQMDDCHTVGVCDPMTGKCSNPTKADGAKCDDMNSNTVNDTCTAGVCTGVSRCKNVVCQAISDCHDAGVCDDSTGLCSEPVKSNGSQCDDGDASTDPDTCQGGVCVGVDKCLSVKCTGNDPCNVASCVMGQCQVTPKADGTKCDNSGGMCDAGQCINKCKNVSCIAPSQCHENGVCDMATGKCSTVFKPNNATCDDGNIATGPDTCDGAGACTGPNICDGVHCAAIGQCYLAGVCDPARANNENGTCTTPMKADGIPCNDFDDSTFQDVCKMGQCVGSTCNITVLQQFGSGSCTFGKMSGGPDDGGYGWTAEGNMYTDSGCRAQFRIEETGEIVMCNNPIGDYMECKLKTRMQYANCLPKPQLCQTACQPLGQCYEAGVCDPATGVCSNPTVADGTLCDDNNANTTDDKCVKGVCVGVVDPPGCYKASVWWPSQQCKHDPSACNWGNNVWPTMEECCRPGHAFTKGCAPEPPTPSECWRAGKWWPNRECVKDMNACNWGLGTSVWGSKDECCKPGNAFDCGCNEPVVEQQCWVDSKGTPERTCLQQNITNGKTCEESGLHSTEEACCKSAYPYTGCSMPCKTLDVVLVIDGSGSMKGRFTNHPHGFYALISMLHDWVSNLPLTSEKAGEILPAAQANGGVRVGIVQFSSRRVNWGGQESYAIKTPSNYKSTTGGRLSGDKNELLMDIAWHKTHFISYGTMIQKGLLMAADMFENIDRPRAIIIITDGEIFDTDKLKPVRAALDAKNVVVFGVVIRQRYYHTAVDQEAEDKLLSIISKPEKDHFFNIEIDDVPEKVLHGVCDPKSQWGAYVKETKGKIPQGNVATPGVFNPVQPSATGHASIWFRSQGVQPFDDLDCDFLHSNDRCDGRPACDAVIYGSSVSIADGYDSTKDVLSCPKCKKVAVEWRSATGILVLKGAATVREYTEALSQVTFTSSADCANRTFTYSYGMGFSGPKALGHTYQYFAHRDINWDKAQALCEAKLDLGRKGYLITVTNQDEAEIAKQKLGGRGWMGASDSGTEGTWRWVTGPEGCPPKSVCDLGLSDWLKNGGHATGPEKNGGSMFYDQTTQVSSGFTNWAAGEPNNWRNPCPGSCAKDGEDFAHFLWPSGEWNDYPLDHKIDGYICEWGETPSNACLNNHVGSRVFTCGTNPTNPSTCGVRPTKPPTQSGCASGWISTDSATDRSWCNANCMDKKGKLIAACKPGAAEKCVCLPEQVKQCRCEDPAMMMGTYCADLQPLASGTHTCSATTPVIPGQWNETNTAYTGMPPAIAGDGDDAFACYRYERDTDKWVDLGAGQCWDASWDYFARYLKQELDINQCKDECKRKPGCHSVHWKVGAQAKGMCYLNGAPVGGCGAGKRLCTAPKTKPPGCQSCACTRYIYGANHLDTVTCAAQSGSDVVCRPPAADGTCSSGKLCSRNLLTTVTISTGNLSPSEIQKLLAMAAGVASTSVSVSHMCPASACKKSCVTVRSSQVCSSQCPTTKDALLAAGCYVNVNGQWVKTHSRSAVVLGEEMVVHVEPQGTDEENSASVAKLSEISNKAQYDSQYFVNDGDAEAIKAFKDNGVGSVGMAVPVWSSTVQEDNTDGSESGSSGSNSTAWVAALAAMGGLCMAGMAGFAIYNRKSKVSWSDVADKRTTEMADASSPAGCKVYNEMPEVMDEMTPHVPPASANFQEAGSRHSGGSMDENTAALL
eukprot:TRINITY_DN6904_c0_g3_i1.p1 TRINITY_DN6904_c0_g3~~TRINITY_DN6904_c0_g3_i1.p1  ORF type:complete len:2380 (+),score=806.85 TRINITY_DN6904_c0_g3_i1:47-7186(+)